MQFVYLNISVTLKSSALFYALLIAVLMATFSTAFIVLVFQDRIVEDQFFLSKKLEENATSALNYLMATHELVEEEYFDLFGQGADSVWIKKQKWGLFDLALVEAFKHTSRGKQHTRKSGLLGKIPRLAHETSSLYLQDNYKPLTLAGYTKIVGTAYLPASGVKGGYVDGKAFFGGKLIDGPQLRSQKSLPKIQYNIIKHLKNWLAKPNTHSQQSLPDSLRHSFFDAPIIVRDSLIYLEHQLVTGNVCIVADSLIYIGRNSIIEDALLIAPTIYFEDGFEGVVQAFATQRLEVGSSVNLKYPSVLSIIQDGLSHWAAFLNLGANSKITGLVISYDELTIKPSPLINIKKHSLVEGQIYSTGNLDLKGTVHGNVTTSNFKLQTPSSGYDNHLLDVAIQYDRRAEYYVSPHFMENAGNSAIVKWLR